MFLIWTKIRILERERTKSDNVSLFESFINSEQKVKNKRRKSNHCGLHGRNLPIAV